MNSDHIFATPPKELAEALGWRSAPTAEELEEKAVEELFARTEKEEGYSLSLDLPSQTIRDNHGLEVHFDIEPSRKEILLLGLDDIGTTLQHRESIDAYEESHPGTALMFTPVDVKFYSTGK